MMKRILLLSIAILSFSISHAQNTQGSFFQQLLNGLFSILSTEQSQETLKDIVLTQEMIDSANGSFTLNGNYSLEGDTIFLPENYQLIHKRGTLANGTISGNNSTLQMTATSNDVFMEDLTFIGSWNIPEISDKWFAFNDTLNHPSNRIISNILSLANDDVQNHITFSSNRTYYFEMPYKGRRDLGNLVYNYKDNKGVTKRRYFDLYTEDFSYLRIFTIPSNTHVTIDGMLQMLPTDIGAYFIFWEYDKHDVTIDGKGSIAGEVLSHIYDKYLAPSVKYYGEWGFVFCCQKCHNFTFKDITIRDAFGDCLIYRGSAYDNEEGDRFASKLTMTNVKIINARRNGIAIAARDVLIDGCYFEGCGQKSIKGANPRSAVDFETDNLSKYKELGNQNVVLQNCTFKNNVLDIASVNNTAKTNGKMATFIKNCTFTAPLKINTTYWIQFDNCTIPVLHNTVSEETSSMYCTNITFENCIFEKFNKKILNTAKSKNIKFSNCTY